MNFDKIPTPDHQPNQKTNTRSQSYKRNIVLKKSKFVLNLLTVCYCNLDPTTIFLKHDGGAFAPCSLREPIMFLRKGIFNLISINSLSLFTFGTLQNEKSQNYQRSFAKLRTNSCNLYLHHGLI